MVFARDGPPPRTAEHGVEVAAWVGRREVLKGVGGEPFFYGGVRRLRHGVAQGSARLMPVAASSLSRGLPCDVGRRSPSARRSPRLPILKCSERPF